MNTEDIIQEKYTCISWILNTEDGRNTLVYREYWILKMGEIHLYILSQRRAVFVRLCGTIKHRERQSRTLFLQRITTHSDMTYLRLPWQNTWEMQVVTGPEISFHVGDTFKPGKWDFQGALWHWGSFAVLTDWVGESFQLVLIFSQVFQLKMYIVQLVHLDLRLLHSIWNFSTPRQISAMNSVPVLRSAISLYRRNRKESAKRLLVQNSLCKQRRGHLSKLFIKNSTANSLWHVVQQCLTLNSLQLST